MSEFLLDKNTEELKDKRFKIKLDEFLATLSRYDHIYLCDDYSVEIFNGRLCDMNKEFIEEYGKYTIDRILVGDHTIDICLHDYLTKSSREVSENIF